MCVQIFRPRRGFSRTALSSDRTYIIIYICIYDSFTAALRFPCHPLGVSLRRQNENRRTGKTGYNSLLHNICVHICIQGESSRFHVYSFNRREETGKPRQATLYAMIINILCIRHTTLRRRRYMISYLSHASAGNIKRLPFAIKTPSPRTVNDDNGSANGQGWVYVL